MSINIIFIPKPVIIVLLFFLFVCLFVVVVVVLCVCVCVVFGVLSLIPSEVLELLMYKVNHLRIYCQLCV